jgi:REP element-mobilizing transposase RayT
MVKHLPKRKSIRILNFDYSQTGIYAVTICTNEKHHLFGKIISGKVILNNFGLIAYDCWNDITSHFLAASLMDFIVMPNHVHGIIAIQNENILIAGAACCAPTKGSNKSKPGRGSLSVIVRSYKSAVTRCIHDNNSADNNKIWQRGFYEHTIRNEEELKSVIEYIKLNPARWEANAMPYSIGAQHTAAVPDYLERGI